MAIERWENQKEPPFYTLLESGGRICRSVVVFVATATAATTTSMIARKGKGTGSVRLNFEISCTLRSPWRSLRPLDAF